ncbi:probable RNA-directed DNA polymerase from transposon BS isoform X2 [Cherax quadricarinatus]|uniref:probable RNA-directed DNA polymerase from transposon BS isoform X2 n=1 Tax=Cherax quadricarinatus TaxID=27406 RepID=UPI00387E2720
MSVYTAASHSIPQTSCRHSQKCVPWWSPACARAVRLKRAAWGRYRYNRTAERLLDFKQKRAIARRVICEAKRTCWQDYVSTITSASSMSAVWKKVRKLSGKYSPDPAPVLRVTGVDVANPLDVAIELGTHLLRISRGLHLCPSFLSSKSARELVPLDFSSLREEQYNVPFTLQELEATLSACRSSAAGPDDIHIRMLQHLHRSALVVLLHLFNLIWAQGVLPQLWKFAIVLPFRKLGTTGHDASHYRPIALTSAVCKVMERLVNRRLMWHLETHNSLSASQYGFRKGRSTIDPLLRLDTYVRNAFANNHSVIAIFFDLEKAYDTTWRYNILAQAHSLGLRGNLPSFLKNFLTDRHFRVRVNNVLSPDFVQAEGVSQGCVLSTTLFLHAINDLASVLPPNIWSSLYVDDFAIACAGADCHLIAVSLQHAVDRVSTWATTHGFKFSSTKTHQNFH